MHGITVIDLRGMAHTNLMAAMYFDLRNRGLRLVYRRNVILDGRAKLFSSNKDWFGASD